MRNARNEPASVNLILHGNVDSTLICQNDWHDGMWYNLCWVTQHITPTVKAYWEFPLLGDGFFFNCVRKPLVLWESTVSVALPNAMSSICFSIMHIAGQCIWQHNIALCFLFEASLNIALKSYSAWFFRVKGTWLTWAMVQSCSGITTTGTRAQSRQLLRSSGVLLNVCSQCTCTGRSHLFVTFGCFAAYSGEWYHCDMEASPIIKRRNSAALWQTWQVEQVLR